jgi:TonB family protein
MAINVKPAILFIGLMATGMVSAVATPGICAEQDTARKATKKVNPAYPLLARKMQLAGTVKLALRVTPGGSVKSIEVIGGHPILVVAAEDAARQWTYVVAPKESRESVEFHFEVPR